MKPEVTSPLSLYYSLVKNMDMTIMWHTSIGIDGANMGRGLKSICYFKKNLSILFCFSSLGEKVHYQVRQVPMLSIVLIKKKTKLDR